MGIFTWKKAKLAPYEIKFLFQRLYFALLFQCLDYAFLWRYTANSNKIVMRS